MIFEDRISKYPGRIKLTDENGEVHYYTLERADEPTQEGTPLNAENLNSFNEAISNVQSTADNAKTTADGHIANTSNPHTVTKAQIGLSNVKNVEQMPKANFSFSNGTLNITL